MPEANTANVAKQLRGAIDAQEKVKQAAKDAAQQAPQPPRAPQDGRPADGGPK